jgi:hypothetical protein
LRRLKPAIAPRDFEHPPRLGDRSELQPFERIDITIRSSITPIIMKTISFALAAMAAGALLAGQGAGAQTLERNAALTTTSDGVGGFNAHFGDAFAAATAGRSFTDVFTFSVAAPFDAAASLTSLYLDSPQTKDLDIVGLNLYRYDPATSAILGNAISGVDRTGIGQHPTDAWSLSAFGLPAGSYAVRIDGRVSGVAGGVFGADLAIAAVPEAQAWSMLAAGLGVLGALAWRRRR